MPWFKVDDQLATHPKTVLAGNAAMGLWVRAGSWSAAHLTDGYVPASVVPMLGATTRQAAQLVKAGFWHAEDDGYRFHDWDVFQPKAVDVVAHKEAQKVAGRRAAHDRWHAKRNIHNPDCDWCTGVAHA